MKAFRQSTSERNESLFADVTYVLPDSWPDTRWKCSVSYSYLSWKLGAWTQVKEKYTGGLRSIKNSQLQDFVAGAAVRFVDVIIKQWSIGDVVEEELWRIEDVVDFEYFKGGC